MSDNKRRHISLLPAINQTTALTRFFGSTVDQVFQPGLYEPINGYIGLYPSYFNAVKDFYISEPTQERISYQLDSGMISINSNSIVDYSLTYPDLLGYLKSQGCDTTIQTRLFENKYYTWAPPIDIDKIVNYHEYYWFGDYTGAVDMPILTITSPLVTYIGDNSTRVFTLPASISSIDISKETAAVYVNSVKVSNVTVSNTTITLPLAPKNGDSVVVTRYNDLFVAITGEVTFDLTGFVDTSISVSALTTGMRVYLQDTSRIFNGWSNEVSIISLNDTLKQQWDETYLSDGTNTRNLIEYDIGIDGNFIVDGVGKSINLISDSVIVRNLDPQYVTIDRDSLDKNPWSMRNNWYHKDSFSWSGLTFPDRKAKRPIIEFIPNIQLYNYGSNRLVDVHGVLSSSALLHGTTPLTFAQIEGNSIGSVSVDNDVVLFDGMQLLIAQQNGIEQLYLVRSNSNRIVLTKESQNSGDLLTILPISGYGPAGTEMYFDGVKWNKSQTWTENSDPLFALFDNDGVSLDDPTRYPNSDFSGNRIFGFASGSTKVDPILLRQLSYDNNGSINFENYISTKKANTLRNNQAFEIIGLYCYRNITSSIQFQSVWQLHTDYSVQDSVEVDSDGNRYYSTPFNLTANPKSDEIGIVSRSLWVEHFKQIIEGQDNFTGSAFASNNWRDSLKDYEKGNSVLQHTAPLLKLMLLGTEPLFDYFAAIRYSDQEYNLFRNKFTRKMIEFDHNGTLPISATASDWVDAILANLKISKSDTFPFALSNMAGGKYFIPSTPTFLGVLPSHIPSIFTDHSYYPSISMIRGHDGSLTPAFNDWRDSVLLELENRIYDNIPSQYSNSDKLVFDFNFYTAGRFCPAITGHFIASDTKYTAVSYNRRDVSNLLAPIFERWAQRNHFDYRTNGIFDPLDPFTWNYRGCLDPYGSALPGHWRAIYRWYFDTTCPHTNPWEMLGFANKPSWWVAQYGSAPYSSTNSMWRDLEAGLIRSGDRAGIDTRYARPGLSSVLPVDISGNLLDPVSSLIVTNPPDNNLASREWANGDGGPAENIWMISPDYRFALAEIAFLMKPARLVEMTWDSVNYGFASNEQWIDFRTHQRPKNADNYVHGEIGADGKTRQVVYGIQQWISDYLVSMGKNPSLLGGAVRGLDVRLIHRMASFVPSGDLRVVSDSFGILPAEDTQVILYNSPSTRTEVYSGVIVEWIGSGWKVIGYDARDPFFKIIPSDTFGPKGIVSLTDTPEDIVQEWHPTTYYRVSQIVDYKGNTYKAIKQHTSGQRFDTALWELTTATYPQAPRVIKYLNGIIESIETVSYGTEFYTLQEVADFIFGYERYLISRGWKFDVIDSNSNFQDWTSSVKEFLNWTQAKWTPGNFIALSPGAEELHFEAKTGTVLDVENNNTGFFGLLDRSGASIAKRSVLLSRLDGNLSLIAKSADIFSARLRIVDIEHALIFSNITIFNDLIYSPVFNMRQARLKLIGNKTSGWAGRMDAPGFIIEGNSITPNFDRNVTDIQEMFDIEKANRKDFVDYARHTIGYQARDYLENLLLSEVEQFEFYQGMIQQKGAPGVFEKLLRSQRVNNSSNIKFLEEYAIRTSRFGSPISPKITFLLNQSSVVREPQFIRLGDHAVIDPTWIDITSNDSRWIDKPTSTNFFSVQNTISNIVIPSAGHVRLDEVSSTLFHTFDMNSYYNSSIANNVSAFNTGDRTWIYEDSNYTWNVFEAFEIGNSVINISNTTTFFEDITVQGLRIYFDGLHNLTNSAVGKSIVIDGLSYCSPEIQGIQTIEIVNTVSNWIEINVAGVTGYNFANVSNGNRAKPNVRIFNSVRFATMSSLSSSPIVWATNDMVWIDSDSSNNNLWSVYKRNNNAWELVRSQPEKIDTHSIKESILYDISTKFTSDKKIYTDEPILNDFVIIDPLNGILAGVADREIDIKSEFDPAKYSSSLVSGSVADAWDNAFVGRVWWDLSTVKYLEAYTDVIGISDSRDYAEINYRTNNWAKPAPNTFIDVYEWIKSDVAPLQYSKLVSTDKTGKYTGVVYNETQPSYTQTSEYSAAFGRDITYYYFWVKNLNSIPNVAFRKKSVSDVANILASPTAQELPWFAPIMPDGLIISGIGQYLNEKSTALKISLNSKSQDLGHDEWLLARPNDERSLPPDWLWRKIVNSLSGFDENKQSLPDSSLHISRATGILEKQNIFLVNRVSVGDRINLLEARRSFVGILNNIFSRTALVIDRLEGISNLSRNTPVDDYLSWYRTNISYAIIPPPSNEWDYEVFSIEERNNLVFGSVISSALVNNLKIRVLVNGIKLKNPQWSIWEFNLTIANALIVANSILAYPSPIIDLLHSNADTIFSIAKTFEFKVSSHSDRNNLTNLNINDRVLVTSDETNNDFWVIYKYDPTNLTSDKFGFYVFRVQSYRTSDFYSIIDWYEQNFDNNIQKINFSASNPPQVVYGSAALRDRAEGISPSNYFVEIKDSITGNWTWEYYLNGVWNTVARNNSTIALSDNFYNSNLLIHNVTTEITSTIVNRDGSWEIKVLADAIRYGQAITDLEINEIFFSMIHFIHTQQNSVDWIFKTSFMNIAGYSVPLQQSSIQTQNVTDSLISYINEVKPYHVKIRDYSTQYTPDIDISNTHVIDFDFPVYFDNTIQNYRNLKLDSATDLNIIQTQKPWKDWWDNHTLSYEDSPIRHMNVSIEFDRLTDKEEGWDELPLDTLGFDMNETSYGTAADRILTEYLPKTNMLPLDVPSLIASLFNYPVINIDGAYLTSSNTGTTYRGEINANVSVNPNVTIGHDPGYGRFSNTTRLPTDLYLDTRHPEERISTLVDDAVMFKVKTTGIPGAPSQEIHVFDSENQSISQTYHYHSVAQSSDAVMVYGNGIRYMSNAYTVDLIDKSITINSTATSIYVRNIGFGGNVAVLLEHFISFDNTKPILPNYALNANNVQVIVAGLLVNSNTYTCSNVNGIQFNSAPPANTDIVVVVWDGNVSNTCRIINQEIPISNASNTSMGKLFTITNPDSHTIPSHAGTIVEVNGKRLTPPLTHYNIIDTTKRYISVDFSISENTIIDLVIDGNYHSSINIPRWNANSSTVNGNPFNIIVDNANLPDVSLAGNFVIFDNKLVVMNSAFNSNNIISIFYENSLYDYKVSNNTVEVFDTALMNSSSVHFTTFTNSDVMVIRTHTHFANAVPTYHVTHPISAQYTMVSVAGIMQAPEKDYDFYNLNEKCIMTIPGSSLHVGKPVITTVFSGHPAQLPEIFQLTTITPAAIRMEQVLTDGGWDSDNFDDTFTLYDFAGAWKYDRPRYANGNLNPVQVYNMRNRWEFLNQSDIRAGTLVSDFAANATTITVNLNFDNISPKLWAVKLQQETIANVISWKWVGDVFPNPDVAGNKPGVVWINDERIEYFSLTYDPPSYSSYPSSLVPPNIILSVFNRGTRGTTSLNENRIVLARQVSGIANSFSIAVVGSTEIQVQKGSATTISWSQYLSNISNSIVNLDTIDRVWLTTNDYNINVINNVTIATTYVVPPNGAFLTMGVCSSMVHLAGSAVINGTDTFEPFRFYQDDPSRLNYAFDQPI